MSVETYNKGSRSDSTDVSCPVRYVTRDYTKVGLKCPKIGKSCMLCGKSRWNPVKGEQGSTESLFCGLAPPSWDLRVDSLPDCPQNMTKSQLSNWQKKQKNIRPLRLVTK